MPHSKKSACLSSRTWVVFHIDIDIAEMHHPLLHCAHTHCLVSSTRIDECQAQFVFTCKYSVPHLCLIHTSMSDTILSDCPLLPPVTQQQNVTEYWWEGSASSAMPPASTSNCGPALQNRSITFGEVFISGNNTQRMIEKKK